MSLGPPILHESASGGLRTLYVKAPPPLTAAIVFRVGVWDETILNRGITHLVEHLALHPQREARHPINGLVDGTRLMFSTSGRGEQIAEFLSRLAGSLRELPVERLETEAGVLRAENESKPFLFLDYLLAVRFGPNGPGMTHFSELGVDHAGPKEVQAWADRHCVLNNAVLLVAGPEPREFRLDLPDGEPCPYTLPGPDVGHRPQGLESVATQNRGICVGALMERSAASVLALELLNRRLMKCLRHEKGLIHSLSANYLPLDAKMAFLFVGADAAGDRQPPTASHFLAILRGLRKGPEPAELEDLKEGFHALMEGQTESDFAWSELHRLAEARLLGAPVVSWQDLVAERQAATCESVAEACGAFLDRAAVVAPGIEDLGLRAPVPRDDPPLPGRVFRQTGRSAGHCDRIRIGPEGLSVFKDRTCLAFRWSDIVLADRPTRTTWVLLHRNGTRVVLDPSTFWWKRTVARLLAEHIPRDVRLPLVGRRE